MLKKILALMLAVLMLGAFAVGCKKKPDDDVSSKKPSSSQVGDVTDSSVESIDSSNITVGDEDDDSSYWPYPWTIETTSAYFRDSEEAKESITVSDSIKQYKDHGKLEIGCYQSTMMWMENYGTDFASREREFSDLVKMGYFNVYMTHMSEYMLTEAKYIAEAGATLWLFAPQFNSKSQNIDKVIEETKYYVDLLKDNGYGDIFQGFCWDEPIWHGMSNEDFATLTEALYKAFGTRNFPVFATGEFSIIEANEADIQANPNLMKKLDPAACDYVTDISFDAYSIDVRDGASNGGASKYQRWTEAVGGKPITDGKSFYRQFKAYLLEYVGRDINYWWWPTMYEASLVGGLNGLSHADEKFCIAHLNFLAEELIKDDKAGGIMLFTYSHFGKIVPIKGDTGDWAIDFYSNPY